MMGYSHAVTGAAGWLAITSTSSLALGVYGPGSSAVILAGSLLCAGAAMAPDADHGQASIAHSLPPVTRWMAQGIGALSGGHRHGTHSIIGVAVFTLFTWLMSFWVIDVDGRTVALGSGIMAVFLVAFATKTFGLHRSLGTGVVGDILGSGIGPWIVALGTAGAATWYLDERWAWLPVCMAVGCFIHVLGDSLTVQGVPWLWPWNPKPPQWVRDSAALRMLWMPNGYFRFPVLGRTGGGNDVGVLAVLGGGRGARHKTSWQETLFIGVVTLYALYLIAYEFIQLFGVSNMLV